MKTTLVGELTQENGIDNWISVEDKTHLTIGFVWLFFKSGYMTKGRENTKTGLWYDEKTNIFPFNPTHWQPLPNKPNKIK